MRFGVGTLEIGSEFVFWETSSEKAEVIYPARATYKIVPGHDTSPSFLRHTVGHIAD